MRTIVHVSDLHFGRVDPQVVAGLTRSVEALRPDVIAVSGDLTQRARPREFLAARAFLQTLPAPKVIVPGNHDIPLYDVVSRFVSPLARYRRYIGSDVEPSFVDDEIVVVGVNTARSLTFKGGRINVEQMRRARALFCRMDDVHVRIVVTHHPFHLEDADAVDLVGRGSMALSHWRACLPDILLAGHMHTHATGTTAQRYDLGGKSAIVVQAGTATSTRGRGESNSFNVLNVSPRSVAIRRFDWQSTVGAFAVTDERRYARPGNAWEVEERTRDDDA
ncbi:MAG: metallophosphoesterase [Casimicrobiaceae bacterium]